MHMGWCKCSGIIDSMGETVYEMTDLLPEYARYAEKAQWV